MSMSIDEKVKMDKLEQTCQVLVRQMQELTEAVKRCSERKKPGRPKKHG